MNFHGIHPRKGTENVTRRYYNFNRLTTDIRFEEGVESFTPVDGHVGPIGAIIGAAGMMSGGLTVIGDLWRLKEGIEPDEAKEY